MNPVQIFCRSSELVGRTAEVERLCSAARSGESLTLLAEPGAGTSELLRHVHAELFAPVANPLPVYFEFRDSDHSIKAAATRFLHSFLVQAAAFRLRRPEMISLSPTVSEIAQIMPVSDAVWVDRLIENSNNAAGDASEFARMCLAAPLRAAANGQRVCVILDGFEVIERLEEGRGFGRQLGEIYGTGHAAAIFAGYRRAVYGHTAGQSMNLERLRAPHISQLVHDLAGSRRVEISDETADLISVQLNGDARAIDDVLQAAAFAGQKLTSYASVQQAYAQEIFGGRISRRVKDDIERALPAARDRQTIIRLLGEAVKTKDQRLPLTVVERSIGMEPLSLRRGIEILEAAEYVSITDDEIVVESADLVFRDIITVTAGLADGGRTRANIIAGTLLADIERAPQLMARSYRSRAASDLAGVFREFAGRSVPLSVLDYGSFRSTYKGAEYEQILDSISQERAEITLPEVLFTSSAVSFYPPLAEIIGNTNAAVGLGLIGKDRRQTVWIAAEIESKLEAEADLAEYWCDRLEALALNCGFENYQLWLITPEGFTEDALDALRERSAYGSSRRQIDLLKAVLTGQADENETDDADVYEVAVPMGPESEMITVRTFEEIARRHDFPDKATNQIKTALVEACINAAEHSSSPDRRVRQRFEVYADRVRITISNRGVRIADKQPAAEEKKDQRRGWGIKLIRGLMDEVEFAGADDGTSVVMTKYLKPQAPAAA